MMAWKISTKMRFSDNFAHWFLGLEESLGNPQILQMKRWAQRGGICGPSLPRKFLVNPGLVGAPFPTIWFHTPYPPIPQVLKQQDVVYAWEGSTGKPESFHSPLLANSCPLASSWVSG